VLIARMQEGWAGCVARMGEERLPGRSEKISVGALLVMLVLFVVSARSHGAPGRSSAVGRLRSQRSERHDR
jgi:hypothetical protein